MRHNADTLAGRMMADSDVEAEKLIGLLRMTLAAMLFVGVSFVLSQIQGVGLELRRFELLCLLAGATGYFLIGTLNYLVARSGRFQPWMSWVFNISEILLLAIQLYIDVMDPDTPSLMAFSSPVLLIAALVICVQVLRYRLELHIASAVVLILLCALVVFHDPQLGREPAPSVIEELLFVYSPPPNVIRLVMLGAMSFVVGVAVYRSHRLIERVAHETEEAENRKRFLPRELSENMNDEGLALLRDGEEREMAVMFADLRGFTALSEGMQPKEIARFLAKFRSLVSDAAVSHSGIVDKFIGDGALVVFGLHSNASEAAKNAVLTSKALIHHLEAWNLDRQKGGRDQVRVAIAVHVGPVVIGAIGDDKRLEFTAIGSTVNAASRLEQIAKQCDAALVISRRVAEAAELDEGEYASLGNFELKGLATPIEVLKLP